MTGQLALAFDARTAHGRDDFLVAECNRAAVAWIDAWPEWPGAGLVLCGPPASGKTHLAEIWRARAAAATVDAARLSVAQVAEILGGAGSIVVEATPPIGDERALLHLHNLVVERGGHILIVAPTPPARWSVALPDLRSRLLALPAVEIGPPDDALIETVLVKHFADRQIRVEPEVVAYVASRLERSLAAVRDFVARADAAALASRRPITVPLARALLAGAEADEKSS